MTQNCSSRRFESTQYGRLLLRAKVGASVVVAAAAVVWRASSLLQAGGSPQGLESHSSQAHQEIPRGVVACGFERQNSQPKTQVQEGAPLDDIGYFLFVCLFCSLIFNCVCVVSVK
jgi:hypothetical protein